jgi:hypothetical protein
MYDGTLRSWLLSGDNFKVPLPKTQALRGWLNAIDDAGGIVGGNALLLVTYWFCLEPCQQGSDAD